MGQQGKSEEDIIKFAKSLTSADYEIGDIIFSKRISLQENALYRVEGVDYQALKDNMESLDEVRKIAGKYYNCNASSVREALFELLSRDENVHDLSEMLKDESKDFNNLYNEFFEYMSKEELIALIDIINAAEKDGIGLFDLKYHSFVRPLSGAYITCLLYTSDAADEL